MARGRNADRPEGLQHDTAPETWARRLQRGDPPAVQEAHERVRRILAYGPLQIPPQELDDLAQEVMTEVWQAVNRSRFDFSGGFWGFVEVVTSRRCIDWLRSRKKEVSVPEDLGSMAPGPLRTILDRERSKIASEVLSTLGADCRQLILLRLRDDLSYKEIARITGAKEGALRVRFYRCVSRAGDFLYRLLQTREPGTGRTSRETEDRA